MKSRFTFSLLAAALLALLLPAFAAAQGGYGNPDWGRDRNRNDDDYYRRNRNDDPYGRNGGYGRNDNRYLRDTIRDLDRLSNDFKNDLDQRLDRSRSNGTRYEDHINADATEFRRAVQQLRNRFNDRNFDRSVNEAREVLETAGHVQSESRRFLNDNRLSSEWSQIRRDLQIIADAYGLSWNDFEDGQYRQDNPYPRDNNRNRNDDWRRNRNGNRNNDWWRNIPWRFPN